MTKAQMVRTRWGGIADGAQKPSGFFRVAERGGIFWLVDPDGGQFLSKGINTVRFDQDKIQNSGRIPYAENCARKYGSEDAWRRAAAARIVAWGFNTLGSWSDEAVAKAAPVLLALTPNLDLGMSFAWQTNDTSKDKLRQDFPDVFDPDFERHVRKRAAAMCAPRRNDANIIGWFVDNELRWGPDWRGEDELLTLFLSLTPGTPGRNGALAFLRARYGDFAKFDAAWHSAAGDWQSLAALTHVEPPYRRTPSYARNDRDEQGANRESPGRASYAADCDAFADEIAERYFSLTMASIKAADPNHLVLGARFAYPPRRGIVEACGRRADVLSFNCYGDDPEKNIDTYAVAGKPCLIGEFSFRAMDSGLPNTNGAGPVVTTQDVRAAAFRRYVTSALRKPSVVGYHWFEHADQPVEGRFDGENSNFGTVTIRDEVYELLTNAMTSMNAEAEQVHTAVTVTA